MNITVISVGKIKEKYFTDAVLEYSKRLGRYCKLKLIEVADEKTVEGASNTEEELLKKKEAERIFKYIKADAYTVALAIEGKGISSVELADVMKKITVNGCSHIIFIIGGSLGLHQTVFEEVDFLLSFSAMTFPHQLMRVILLEQIYRSFRILNNEPYHK